MTLIRDKTAELVSNSHTSWSGGSPRQRVFLVSQQGRPQQASHHRSQGPPKGVAGGRHWTTVPTLRFPSHIWIAYGHGRSRPPDAQRADRTLRYFDHHALCASDAGTQTGGSTKARGLQPRSGVCSLRAGLGVPTKVPTVRIRWAGAGCKSLKRWRAWEDLNLRPLVPETSARMLCWWFFLLGPARYITVLHDIRRLMDPNRTQVFRSVAPKGNPFDPLLRQTDCTARPRLG